MTPVGSQGLLKWFGAHVLRLRFAHALALCGLEPDPTHVRSGFVLTSAPLAAFVVCVTPLPWLNTL